MKTPTAFLWYMPTLKAVKRKSILEAALQQWVEWFGRDDVFVELP